MYRYNPKYDFICEKNSPGPAWDASFKKTFSINPQPDEDKKIYLSQKPLNEDSCNFVDFDRQTKRLPFCTNNNLRSIQVTSGECFNKKKNKIASKSVSFLENSQEQDKKSSQMNKSSTNIWINDKTFNKYSNNSNRELESSIYDSSKKLKSDKNASKYGNSENNSIIQDKNSQSLNKQQKQQLINRIPAPDFKKIVSREKYIKCREQKTHVYRFIVPNMSQTQFSK